MSNGRIPGVGQSKTNWLKPQKEFAVVKEVDDRHVLLRRIEGGELFLGQAFDLAHAGDGAAETVAKLLRRNTQQAVSQILNHENLVSMVAVLTNYPLQGGSDPNDAADDGGERVLVWDYCDAGSLRTLFDHPPFPRPGPHNASLEWLPESLCWHVLTGVLRALAWLHEGWREEADGACSAGTGGGGTAVPQGQRARRVLDRDWMPVLHRRIRPENVFFQQPRGVETYGMCKLGDFSACVVSGHVNSGSSFGPVVTTHVGDHPLDSVRQWVTEESPYKLEKVG